MAVKKNKKVEEPKWEKEDIRNLTKNELLVYINNVKNNSGDEDIYKYLTYKYKMKDYPRETLIKVGERLWDHGFKPSKEWYERLKNNAKK